MLIEGTIQIFKAARKYTTFEESCLLKIRVKAASAFNPLSYTFGNCT